MRILNRDNPHILISLVLPILISAYVCVYVEGGVFSSIQYYHNYRFVTPHHSQDAQQFHHYKNYSCCPCITQPTFSFQPPSLTPSNFLFSKCYINRSRQYLISETGLFHTEAFLESHLSCGVDQYCVSFCC